MDITSKNNADGSIEIKVVLTPEDTMRLPNAMRVLDGANSCTEILLALTVMAQEMTFKQAEFQAALRQATAEKAARTYCPLHGCAGGTCQWPATCKQQPMPSRVDRREPGQRRSNIVRRQDEESLFVGPDRRAAFGPGSRRSGAGRRK